MVKPLPKCTGCNYKTATGRINCTLTFDLIGLPSYGLQKNNLRNLSKGSTCNYKKKKTV